MTFIAYADANGNHIGTSDFAPAGSGIVATTGFPVHSTATWDGKNWNEPAETPAPLTLRQFTYLLAKNSLETVLETVLTELEATDRTRYAEIKADLVGASLFHFETVTEIVYKQDITPAQVAVKDSFTEADLKVAWLEARQF